MLYSILLFIKDSFFKLVYMFSSGIEQILLMDKYKQQKNLKFEICTMNYVCKASKNTFIEVKK